MKTTDRSEWSEEAPTEVGNYWLYGDEEFGTMGGNYNGTFPPEIKLHYVEIFKISNGLMAQTGGRIISMEKFDFEKRKAGYLGLWQKVKCPALPKKHLEKICEKQKFEI